MPSASISIAPASVSEIPGTGAPTANSARPAPVIAPAASRCGRPAASAASTSRAGASATQRDVDVVRAQREHDGECDRKRGREHEPRAGVLHDREAERRRAARRPAATRCRARARARGPRAGGDARIAPRAARPSGPRAGRCPRRAAATTSAPADRERAEHRQRRRRRPRARSASASRVARTSSQLLLRPFHPRGRTLVPRPPQPNGERDQHDGENRQQTRPAWPQTRGIRGVWVRPRRAVSERLLSGAVAPSPRARRASSRYPPSGSARPTARAPAAGTWRAAP